jgi:hypothetical protein
MPPSPLKGVENVPRTLPYGTALSNRGKKAKNAEKPHFFKFEQKRSLLSFLFSLSSRKSGFLRSPLKNPEDSVVAT